MTGRVIPMGYEIEPALAAHYVLGHAGYRPGRWMPPGSFYEELVGAAFRADAENLIRISAGFPAIAEAVRLYRQDPDLLVDLADTLDTARKQR